MTATKDIFPSPNPFPKQERNTEIPPPLAGEARWGNFDVNAHTTRNREAMEKANTLRTNSTDAERKLWAILRGKQMENFKFRRQQPIGPYIVDFACMELHLIIELDGGQHGETAQDGYDAARTAFLEKDGYHMLRFWNNEVLQNIEGVAYKIRQEIRGRSFPPLTPPASGGRKAKEAAA